MRRLSTTLVSLSFVALAGCANQNHQPESMPNTSPVVQNAERLTSNLGSLYDTLDILGQPHSLKPTSEQCMGLITQSAVANNQLEAAANYLSASTQTGLPQTPAEKLYASNLDNRAANLSEIFGKLWRLCPEEAETTRLPKSITINQSYN